MNGALMKASSRFAIAAALGLVVGVGSVRAADLGGNCCADLEERIAELEATTARKGNRKMSLTITGQVHRMVLWWDDGHSSKTYYGLDNTNSSSRFIFLGSARVNPSVTMGFEIMIEIEAGGTSSKVNQFDEDGKVGAQISGLLGPSGSFNQSNVDAYFGDARRVAWWIEHKDVGRLTVGRYESAGVVQTIDLGGIGMVASSSFILVNGSFFIRGPTGQYYAMSWANIGDPAANQGRTELVRYDSPTWHGFIYHRVDRRGRRLLGQHAALRQRVQRRAHRGGHRLRAVQGPRDAGHARPDGAPSGSAHRRTSRLGVAPCRCCMCPPGLFVQGHYTVGRLQRAWPYRQRVLGLRGWPDQEGRHAVADPGRYRQELVRHRQHRSLRRVRRGHGLGC